MISLPPPYVVSQASCSVQRSTRDQPLSVSPSLTGGHGVCRAAEGDGAITPAEPMEVSSRDAAPDSTAAAPMDAVAPLEAAQQPLAGDGGDKTAVEEPLEGLIPAKRFR